MEFIDDDALCCYGCSYYGLACCMDCESMEMFTPRRNMSDEDLIHKMGGCYCYECEYFRSDSENGFGLAGGWSCCTRSGMSASEDGWCSNGKMKE